MSGSDYQLLDFGEGRRLERFGEVVLDRPSPPAEPFLRSSPALWKEADALFDGRTEERGRWIDRRELPQRWTLAQGPLRFELKRTEFGHLGLFPEQSQNWDWLARVLPACLREKGESRDDNRPKVLNLFAYTGGSTLAAAAAGAEVTHVDAAGNVVGWARRNAELSGLGEAPIRWIAEDAAKFVKRELKRENYYDAVILDPPSYGHGPRGEVWRLSKHLPRLLDLCGALTADRLAFLLVTCHTPGYDAETLKQMLVDHISLPAGDMEARPLAIRALDGRCLPSGVVVRWCCSDLYPRSFLCSSQARKTPA